MSEQALKQQSFDHYNNRDVVKDDDNEEKYDDLELYPIGELKNYKVSPGHLFYVRKSSRPLKLLNAGDFVDQEFINKYQKKGLNNLHIKRFVNDEEIEFLTNVFLSLQETKKESEKHLLRKKFLNWSREHFWQDGSSGPILDLICATSSIFYQLNVETEKLISETSIICLQRSLKLAAYSVQLAFILGYLDFQLLSDLYNLCLVLDIGLYNDQFTAAILRACEQERKIIMNGETYLMSGNKNALNEFINHPQYGLNKITKAQIGLIYDEDILSTISRHHPYVISKNTQCLNNFQGPQLSDFESVILLLDKMLPFSEFSVHKGEVKDFFKTNLKDLISNESSRSLPWIFVVKKIMDIMYYEQS